MSENGKHRIAPISRAFARNVLTAEMLQNYEAITVTGCWLWSGKWSDRGYGVVRNKIASRMFYAYHVGDIPPDHMVCHKCDTPACVNPAHLFVGTHDENMQDMMRKGRSGNRAGSRNSRAKLTEQQALAIYRDRKTPMGELVATYGVQQSTVYSIRCGHLWSHVTGQPNLRGKK